MSRVIERVIDVEGRENTIGVRTEGTRVTVRWLCGATRTFRIDDLRTAIKCLEHLESYDDVWLKGKDSNGTPYFARLTDGEFYGDEALSEGSAHVPWKEMRKTLRRAMP